MSRGTAEERIAVEQSRNERAGGRVGVRVAWVAKRALALGAVLFLILQLPATRGGGSVLAFESPMLTSGAPGISSDEPIVLDWRALGGLNYMTGEMTDVLESANGKTVRIPGFMVPLEDFLDNVSEFLLVPYMGACIHVPPPPPNQLVYVRMNDDRKVRVEWWEPIWIEGELSIESYESVYGSVGFQMDGLKVEPYEY
jgi:uncharacterized protein